MVDVRRRPQVWAWWFMLLAAAAVLLVGCDMGEEGELDVSVPPTQEVSSDEFGPQGEDLLGAGEDDPLGGEPGDGAVQTPALQPTLPADVVGTSDGSDVSTDDGAMATDEASAMATGEAGAPTGEADGTPQATGEAGAQDGASDSGEAVAVPLDQPMVALASRLLQMDVYNEDGDQIAEVEELLLDQGGTLRYVILELSGGGDDDEFAVLWEAIRVQTGERPTTEPETERSGDRFHLVYQGDGPLQQQMAVDLDDFDDDVIVNQDGDNDDAPDEFTSLILLDKLDDIDVNDASGEDMGEIEDVLVALHEGRVVYLIVDFGGFLGIGRRHVPVPFTGLVWDTAAGDDDDLLMLQATAEDLENAPEFNAGDWTPNVGDDWDAEWRAFWEG